jgi:CHAD domain-containing protein
MKFCLELAANQRIRDFISGLDTDYVPGNKTYNRCCTRYYDTFDWRLHASGLVYELFDQGENSQITLRRLSDNQPFSPPVNTTFKAFASDYAGTTLHKRLEKLIGNRALLPLVGMTTDTTRYTVSDTIGKHLAHLHIVKHTITEPSLRRHKTIRFACVVPLRGYTEEARKIVNHLATTGNVAQLPVHPLDLALSRCRRQPEDYTSKFSILLDPGQRADAAAKALLRQLLDTIVINQPGVINNIDVEFLHDFRVAIRRTRSALTQIKNVFPDTVADRFKQEFAWLGGVTGPSRDMDVYLETFDDYLARIPETLRPGLAGLKSYLESRHKAEHQQLNRTLKSPRYQQLIDDWRAWLNSSAVSAETPRNATMPAKQLADQRIWKLYRRILKEGQAITKNSPDEELHELRKTCKKFRYMIEFFQSLYPDKTVRTAVKTLKLIQDNLGDFQDLCVQIDFLENYVSRSKINISQKERNALTSLVAHLEEEKAALRNEFAARFNRFDTPAHQLLYRRLCKTGARKSTK